MAKKSNTAGATLTMDIKNMRDGIDQLKKHMKTLNLEFQAETAHIEKLNQSQDGLEKKLKQLNGTFQDQTAIIEKYKWGIERAQEANNQVEVERLTNELLKAQAALGKTQKEINKYTRNLNELKDSTTEVVAPTNTFKKTIDALEADISLANAEFEETISTMGDWEKSTEGINAKTKQLNAVLNAQKKRLEETQKEYQRVKDEQGENSTEAKKLQTQMSKQRVEIKRVEKELEEYSNTSKKTTKENKKLEKSSKDLEKSNKELKQGFTVLKGVMSQLITRSIAAFIQNISSSISQARELRKELGMLEATAITTGKSFEQASKRLVDVASITDDTGAAVEGLNNLMSAGFSGDALDQITDELVGASIKWKDTLKFEGLADGLQETLATGKAIGPFAELLERAGLNTKKFDEGLANAKSETDKLNYVLQTLSKLGLSDVRSEYEKINKSLVENNEAVLNQQVAYANLNKILEPIHTALLNFGTSIINNKIAPAVEEISGVIIKALNGDMVGALEDGTEIFNRVKQFILDKIIEIGEALPSLIPDIINTLINGIVKGLGQLSKALPQIMEAIVTIVQTLIDELPNIVNNFFDNMDTLFPILLETLYQLVNMLIEALPGIIEGLLEALPTIIDRVTQFLVGAIPMIVEAGIKLLNGLVEALPFVLQALVDNLPSIVNSISQFLTDNIPMLLKAGVDFFKAIAQATPIVLGEIIGKLPAMIFAIAAALLEQQPEMFKASVEIFTQIIRGLAEVIVHLIKYIPQFMKSVFDGFMDTLGSFKDIGKNLVEGLWKGIEETGQWLKDKINGFGESVTKWFEGVFKVKSPSRLMRDRIGKNLGFGIGEGLLDSTNAVAKDIDKFSKNITKDFQSKVKNINAGLQGSLSVNGASNINGNIPTTNVNNFTQVINAPKQPSRIELYRQTKNLLALKGGY